MSLGKLFYPECSGEIEFFETAAEAENCAIRTSRINCGIFAVILLIVAVVIYVSNSASVLPAAVVAGVALVIFLLGPMLNGAWTARVWTQKNYEIQRIQQTGASRYQAAQQVINTDHQNSMESISERIADRPFMQQQTFRL